MMSENRKESTGHHQHSLLNKHLQVKINNSLLKIGTTTQTISLRSSSKHLANRASLMSSKLSLPTSKHQFKGMSSPRSQICICTLRGSVIIPISTKRKPLFLCIRNTCRGVIMMICCRCSLRIMCWRSMMRRLESSMHRGQNNLRSEGGRRNLHQNLISLGSN